MTERKPRAIEIVLTNEDKGYRFAQFCEPLADSYVLDEDSTMGDIFREAQKEYGRCTGKIYVDRHGEPPLHVGWFFVSRQEYEDSRQSYLRGAWVTVGEYVPPRSESVHYQ